MHTLAMVLKVILTATESGTRLVCIVVKVVSRRHGVSIIGMNIIGEEWLKADVQKIITQCRHL